MFNNEILWSAMESRALKKKKIIFFESLLISTTLFFFISFLNITSLFVKVISFIAILSMIIGGVILLIQYSFDLYSQFIVTKSSLIIKKWTFRGYRLSNSLDIDKIKTIYIVEKSFSDKNSINFFSRTVEEILEKNPLGEYQYDSFRDWDFQFKHVGSPNELLNVFESLIPLKRHPTLKNIYERIE